MVRVRVLPIHLTNLIYERVKFSKFRIIASGARRGTTGRTGAAERALRAQKRLGYRSAIMHASSTS